MRQEPSEGRIGRQEELAMSTGMAGVYMIGGFIAISGTILFWKLIGWAIDEMKYRNNRD